MTASIRSQVVFDGPNIWASAPVTHFVVDAPAGPPVSIPFDPIFAELEQWVHEGVALAPIPAREADDPGWQISLLALNLQRLVGAPVGFYRGGVRTDGDDFDVVVEHVHAAVARQAVKLALRITDQVAVGGESSFDLVAAFQQFVVFNETCDGGVMGRAMRAAAVRRGVPIVSIDPKHRLIELGSGCFRQRIAGRLTSKTPITAVQIEGDKRRTLAYLRAAGLPVPDGAVARTLEQALVIARRIGYPVVLKPPDLGDSIGVVLDVRGPEHLADRFGAVATIAASTRGEVLVERYLLGNHYRANVVDGRLISVSERRYPQVIGNGIDRILRLIEIENQHPKRSAAGSSVYKPIEIDEQVVAQLALHGWTLDDVPPAGAVVQVKTGHRRDGTFHTDVTKQVHPDNAEILCVAARTAGLPLAGIDFVMPDLAQSMWESGGGIIELNADTAFNLQLFPAEGAARDPAPAIVEMLFPPGEPVRVPVVAVMAWDGSGAVCEDLARELADGGQVVGVATADGVTIGGTRYAGVDGRNPVGPRTLLNNPLVEIGVVEVGVGSIVEAGLGFGVCDVVVLAERSGLLRPDGRAVETVLLDALDVGGVVLLPERDLMLHAMAMDHGCRVVLLDFDRDVVPVAVRQARAVRLRGHAHPRPTPVDWAR